MEILTAYVRKNSPYDSEDIKTEVICNIRNIDMHIQELLNIRAQCMVSLDIQVIIEIIRKRSKYIVDYDDELDKDIENFCLLTEYNILDLQRTYLQSANFSNSLLDGTEFLGSSLDGAQFNNAHLVKTSFIGAILRNANFEKANMEGAYFFEANLKNTEFKNANLRACLNIPLSSA